MYTNFGMTIMDSVGSRTSVVGTDVVMCYHDGMDTSYYYLLHSGDHC
jgi:hypothetical protein